MTTQALDPHTSTIAEIERYLVELPCPECGGTGEVASVGDHGPTACLMPCRTTGLRFPSLSRPCLRHGGTEWAGGPSCDRCIDGRVPNFTAFGLLNTICRIRVQGVAVFVEFDDSVRVYLGPQGCQAWPWNTEVELIDGLSRALVAAVVAEKEGK